MRNVCARIAGATLLVMALLAAVLLAVAFVPTLFGAEALVVTSGSMGPAMPAGSVAVTRLADAHAVAVGDVISFRRPGAHTPVTHRVIAVTDDGKQRVFRTKGDANPAPDPEPVRVRERIHVVQRVVPYAGWIVRSARTPGGVLVLFLIPTAGLVRERRRERRDAARRRAGGTSRLAGPARARVRIRRSAVLRTVDAASDIRAPGPVMRRPRGYPRELR